jgi:vitamin B12 transporter
VNRIIFISVLILLNNLCKSQEADTIKISEFEVKESIYSVSSPYKKTTFDSLTFIQHKTSELSDLLISESSVFVKNYGNGALASVSFRGTGANHTQVYWNGINLNSSMNGQIDFNLFPLFFTDYAELHHGASSIADGSGGLGGSVQLLNSDFKESVNIMLSAGSFDHYQSGFKANYSLGKLKLGSKVYYKSIKNDYAFLNYTKSGFPKEYLINAEVLQQGFMQSFEYDFSAKSKLSFYFWLMDSDRNLPQPISSVGVSDESQKDNSKRFLLEWKKLFANGILNIKTAYLNDFLEYQSPSDSLFSISNSNSLKSVAQYKHFFKKAFTTKIQFQNSFDEAKTDGYNSSVYRNQFSSFLQISKKFKELIYAETSVRAELIDETFLPIMPAVSLVLFPDKKISYKANVAKHVRYPSLNDLYWTPGGNPNLEPEQGWMEELGVAYQTKSFTAEVTAFNSYIKNWILWSPTSKGYWSPQNIKEVNNYGLETFFKYDLKIKSDIKLRLTGNYTLTKSINKKVTSESDASLDKQLIYVPIHNASGGLIFSYKKWMIGGNTNFTSDRFINSDNTTYLPYYHLVNAFVAKNFELKNHNISAKFQLNNITNVEYYVIAYRPMPPTNFMFTLSYNFAPNEK